ncbi:hypothetical protein F1640_18250 [Novosphingobium sp. NBM11]|nr:hypothetical protein [Novosphingobium sp. NBM11]
MPSGDFTPAYIEPTPWASPQTGVPLPGFSDVEFQITALASGYYTPERSLGGDLWEAWIVRDKSGNEYATLTPNEVGKHFTIDGNASIRLNPSPGSGTGITAVYGARV